MVFFPETQGSDALESHSQYSKRESDQGTIYMACIEKESDEDQDKDQNQQSKDQA